jgi:3' terminal RNA ribose 2'-O-methyltransferase Hen1
MLLTLTTTHRPATDLGYLLHKHPDRLQSVELAVGRAHIFYPESSEERTTVALLLDIDPIQLVRQGKEMHRSDFGLAQYVNDRPYVASSFMSVALSRAFATAMNGTCAKRPELVDRPLPLEISISVLPAPKGGGGLIKSCFRPLGYTVQTERHPLDPTFPAWGESPYYTLRLRHTLPLKDALSHLYVLLPAIGADKHYYIGKQEVDKLLAKGAGWLEEHPAREEITRRYLKHLGELARTALSRMDEEEGENAGAMQTSEPKNPKLHQRRLETVAAALRQSGAGSVIDLGCGEGKLLRMLLQDRQFTRIAGTDVSHAELQRAKDRLHYDDMPPGQRQRIEIFQGALTYRDDRLLGFDAAALVEVIEHLDEDRLDACERAVFGHARPGTVVLTTPNAEYNINYPALRAGNKRHADHRFEWSRKEFRGWAERVAKTFGYTVTISGIGPEDDTVGCPSQLAIFTHGN